MADKKVVFLFGAGAVLDWGAPKTICNREALAFIPEHGSDEVKNRVCCLTHMMTATGFYGNDGSRITDKVFKILTSKNAKSSINFETIISVIEDLYAYWASQKSKEPNNLFSMVNLDAQSQDLFFFEHSKPNPVTRKYSISIPKFPSLQEDYVSDELNPILKYYEMFLTDLLGGIKGHVSKYSYYTRGRHNVIFNETNNILNDNFCKWMKSFISDNCSLRMYTLNYDRLFKVLLQNNEVDVFEGFELNGVVADYQQAIPPNLPRIVSDFTSHVHYNLHGSASWNIEELNVNHLPGYQYCLVPFGEIYSPAATIEIEKGRRLLLSNIITGYQKIQKTSISPFRQMFSAFDRDCFVADKLYIVGYSLGDEHINDIIRNSRKYNTKLEIILINPSFDDKQFALDFILHWGRPQRELIYENVGDHELVSPEFKVKIIKRRFGEFLSDD